MARIALDVDHVAVARGDDLAATDAAKGADCYRLGGAAGFERRNRRAAPRLRQGADRYRARCQSLEELAARRLWRLSVCCGTAAVPFHLIFIFIFHLASTSHAFHRRLSLVGAPGVSFVYLATLPTLVAEQRRNEQRDQRRDEQDAGEVQPEAGLHHLRQSHQPGAEHDRVRGRSHRHHVGGARAERTREDQDVVFIPSAGDMAASTGTMVATCAVLEVSSDKKTVMVVIASSSRRGADQPGRGSVPDEC